MIGRAKKIMNDRGESYILVAIISLCIALIFSVVYVYASASSTIRTQKDLAKLELDNFVIDNSTGKAGHNILNIYLIRGKAILDNLNSTSNINSLKASCGLVDEGTYLVCYKNGVEKYRITRPEMSYVEPMKKTLYMKVRYTISVPLRFNGKIYTYANVDMLVKTEFRGITSNTQG